MSTWPPLTLPLAMSAVTLGNMITVTADAVGERMEHLLGDLRGSSGLPGSSDRSGLPGRKADDRALDAVWKEAVEAGRGGKRLRALLLWDTYRAVEPQEDEARDRSVLDLACAVEIYQTSALVHDDIIDDADMRRGRPSSHRQLGKAMSLLTPPGPGQEAGAGATAQNRRLHDGRRVRGRGLGILLGDLLATVSADIARKAGGRLGRLDEVTDTFLGMQRAVTLGQVLDLGMEDMPLDDPAGLCKAALRTMRWKTASYTTVAPIHLGLLAAGADEGLATWAAEGVGEDLGVAYQLMDDLADLESDSSQTGKPRYGDIREGKRTVLLSQALTSATGADRRLLVQAYQAPLRDGEMVDRVASILIGCGAVEKVRTMAADRADRARTRLEEACGRLALGADGEAIWRRACGRFVPNGPRAL